MPRPTQDEIARFLDRTLRVAAIRDASQNGLQVRSRRASARRAGFAVDGCLSTFAKAERLGIDLLVVHHGIKWRPQKDRDLARRREAALRKAGIALYAAHLPLDRHETYGNNAVLCRMLGLGDLKRFGRYHGIAIGYCGAMERAVRLEDLNDLLDRRLHTACRVHRFGTGRVRTVGVVSGGGGGLLHEAVRAGLDCFLVGEIDLAAYNAAREYGMNVIVAGHYATETVGVRALMPLVRETFGVETVFVDDPKEY